MCSIVKFFVSTRFQVSLHSAEYNGRVYLATNNQEKVYQQLIANQKTEVVVWQTENGFDCQEK